MITFKSYIFYNILIKKIKYNINILNILIIYCRKKIYTYIMNKYHCNNIVQSPFVYKILYFF